MLSGHVPLVEQAVTLCDRRADSLSAAPVRPPSDHSVLYRQGRYEESARFAGECGHLASPDDVASQFLWRCVRGKLKARHGDADEAESLLSEAMALIETSDHLDLQGTGLLDFAEIWELAGIPGDAAAFAERAARLFERKGNVVSALRARQLGERLRSSPAVPMRDY